MELTPLSPAPPAVWMFGLGSVLVALTTLAVAHPVAAPVRYRLARPCPTPALRVAPTSLPTPGSSCRADSAPSWLHCQGTTCVIDRSSLQRASAHFATAPTTRERIVPVLRNGHPVGLKVYAIPPCSRAYWLGLRNGDLLTRVNGLDISSRERVVTAYTQLRTASHFQLDLERGGQSVQLAYTLR